MGFVAVKWDFWSRDASDVDESSEEEGREEEEDEKEEEEEVGNWFWMAALSVCSVGASMASEVAEITNGCSGVSACML